MANFGDILSSVTIGAGQSVRYNAGGTAFEAYTPLTAADLVSYVPYSGATGNVTLGTYGLTAGSLTASYAGAGPKLFVYNTAGGGASFSGGAGSSLAYLQFPSSKIFMLAPVSDITASPSSSDGKLIVDSTTVYVGAYGTLNSEKLIVWGNVAMQDNGAGGAAELRLYEPSAGGANYVGFKAPALSANKIWTLPSVDATVAGRALISDAAGALSFGAATFPLTQKSVVFMGASGALSENNQNLCWDDVAYRLSIFSTLGSEIVTNGAFTGSATGWSVPSGMVYSSNAVSKTSNGTGALTQSVSVHNQREYVIVYTISGWTVGTITPSVGSVTLTAVSANGTYTERFIAQATQATLSFTPSNTARFTIDNVSIKPLKGVNTASNLNVGGFGVQGEWSNGGPGTTRAITISNDGSYSWIDYRFSGVLRSAQGANSSGGVDFYASGGNYFAYYYGNSGLTSNSLFSYNYPSAFVHYGDIRANAHGMFGGKVGAGTGSGTTPTSTLQTAGGLALKVKRATANLTLDDTATHWLLDATSAAACTGTPSASCASWTNQTDCEKWDAHGGCVWNPGSSCSAFNNESGMTACSSTSGCSVDTSSCSGATDESSCIAQDDAYGGSCSWNSNDCSLLAEGPCGSTSGCSPNYSDCSSFNGNEAGCTGQSGCSIGSSNTCPSQMDEGSCVSAGCSWDGMTCTGDNSTCSGTYYTSCSGTYYTCDGTYNTGGCSGTYGSGCSGTPTCAGIDDSTNCGNETGCTWSAVLQANLPDGETCPDRTYWIYNDSSGGADVQLIPYSGQTVNEGSSYTLSSYRDWIHIAYFKKTASCEAFSEGACTPSGCSPNYAYCSWDSMGSTCSGNAVCTGIGDQMTCEATQYFTGCTGTYTVSKNWYKFGS